MRKKKLLNIFNLTGCTNDDDSGSVSNSGSTSVCENSDGEELIYTQADQDAAIAAAAGKAAGTAEGNVDAQAAAAGAAAGAASTTPPPGKQLTNNKTYKIKFSAAWGVGEYEFEVKNNKITVMAIGEADEETFTYNTKKGAYIPKLGTEEWYFYPSDGTWQGYRPNQLLGLAQGTFQEHIIQYED